MSSFCLFVALDVSPIKHTSRAPPPSLKCANKRTKASPKIETLTKVFGAENYSVFQLIFIIMKLIIEGFMCEGMKWRLINFRVGYGSGYCAPQRAQWRSEKENFASLWFLKFDCHSGDHKLWLLIRFKVLKNLDKAYSLVVSATTLLLSFIKFTQKLQWMQTSGPKDGEIHPCRARALSFSTANNCNNHLKTNNKFHSWTTQQQGAWFTHEWNHLWMR